MAHQNRFNNHRKRPAHGSRPATAERVPLTIAPRKPPTEYGKPFIVLEDAQKNTFEYRSGAWVPYAMSVAECRLECSVKELPQKINKMTRYEVRLPLSHSTG